MAANEHRSGRSLSTLCLWLSVSVLLFSGPSVHGAYISEIDLGGPAGRGVELSGVESDRDYTLLFLSASPTSTFLFGTVLDVLHVPAGTGRAGVAMVTDQAWPSDPLLTTPLASMPLDSGDTTLPLSDNMLLVVMDGRSGLERGNNPLSQPAADALYDESAVTDWLVLSTGDQASAYQANHDIDRINQELGIGLLSRLVDKDAGRVIGRANAPEQALDMNTFFIGDPETSSNQFEVAQTLSYTYTPGMSGLPLAPHMPEPGTMVGLGLLLGLCCRRPRA